MLTNDQVEELFRFCEKHCVRHYDVQCELVDHLGTAIEAQMRMDPAISFEMALGKVYAGFGVMGFAGIVNSHSAVLEKQYRCSQYALFKEFFTLPKIAATLCALAVLWLLPGFFSSSVLTVFVTVFVATIICFELFLTIRHHRRIRSARRILLLLRIGATQSFTAVFILMQFGLNYLFREGGTIGRLEYYVVTHIAFLLLLGLIAYDKAFSQLFARARKEYPEAFAS